MMTILKTCLFVALAAPLVYGVTYTRKDYPNSATCDGQPTVDYTVQEPSASCDECVVNGLESMGYKKYTATGLCYFEDSACSTPGLTPDQDTYGLCDYADGTCCFDDCTQCVDNTLCPGGTGISYTVDCDPPGQTTTTFTSDDDVYSDEAIACFKEDSYMMGETCEEFYDVNNCLYKTLDSEERKRARDNCKDAKEEDPDGIPFGDETCKYSKLKMCRPKLFFTILAIVGPILCGIGVMAGVYYWWSQKKAAADDEDDSEENSEEK